MTQPLPSVPAVPVYLRVGDGTEYQIGQINKSADLPALLRDAADYAEQIGFDQPSEET